MLWDQRQTNSRMQGYYTDSTEMMARNTTIARLDL